MSDGATVGESEANNNNFKVIIYLFNYLSVFIQVIYGIIVNIFWSVLYFYTLHKGTKDNYNKDCIL